MDPGPPASIDRNLAAIAQRQSAANHLIQALSITQSEHTETLGQHTEWLDSAHAKLDQIIGLLERLIEDQS